MKKTIMQVFTNVNVNKPDERSFNMIIIELDD